MNSQDVGETRADYLKRVCGWIKKAYKEGRNIDLVHYGSCHPSHTANRVMLDAQIVFEDLGSFGVEGWCDDIGENGFNYLNMGETYEDTILFNSKTERFSIGTWGDTYERWERKNVHNY